MEHFRDLQIPVGEIASNTFHKDNFLGGGGFGMVYKGELSRFTERGVVAFKKLDRIYGQGETEFFKEIEMLSQYKHENIITLLGYCMEGKELILVYEYASNGSLDSRIGSPDLTWIRRLKICLQAAKGLRYLHDPNESHLRVIHRDIKSANILLDDEWNAKVSDFGLSKISPENADLVTYATGTTGYSDPQYYKTYSLTEKSDVYSFGVTLFEVLCGRLCYEVIGKNELLVFVHEWMKSYEQKKIEDIVFKQLDMKQIDVSSLKLFSDIAYKCLNESREKRPSMAEVVTELEVALEAQEDYDMILKHPMAKEYDEILRTAVSPVKYRSIEELKERLSEGFLINGGKTWFSVNDKEEHCLLLSIEDCLVRDDPNRDHRGRYPSEKNSRFVAGYYKVYLMNFKIRVITPLFLSPHVTYGVNLVVKYSEVEQMKQHSFHVVYKLLGETKITMVNVTDMREDGWLVAELYHFTNEGENSILDLEIIFEECGLSGFFDIQGIEFQPLGRVEQRVVVAGYEKILKAPVTPFYYRSTEELLNRGILLNGGKTLFCLNDKGQHIERIFIEACLDPDEASRVKHQDDCVDLRFPRGRCYEYKYGFKARVRAEYLSLNISYTVNLIFRHRWQSHVNEYNPLRYKIDGEDETKVFIIYPTDMRQDGWFIAPLYQFTSQHTTADLQFEFESRPDIIYLLVAGIEFQPFEEKVELPVFEEYQDIVKVASQSLFYTSLDELKQILSIGIHLNGYKTWFSLNEKGEHCHMISMKDCLISNEDSTPVYVSLYYSRFPAGIYQTNAKGFKTHVKTQFLSPSVTYTVNLVYDYSVSGIYVDLKYRLRGEATTSIVYLANERRKDQFYMAELYQFTSDGSIVDLEIDFDDHGNVLYGVEGILFQPLEIVEDQVSKKDKVENIQTVSDSDSESDTYWEQNLPDDYEEIINLSIDNLLWTTKKELYSIMRSGFLIGNGQQWFTIDKHGKNCFMVSARATWVIDDKKSACESSHESRFGEVIVITAGSKFKIKGEINYDEPETKHATYLVYKLPQDQSSFEAPIDVIDEEARYPTRCHIYLVSPPVTPVIGPKLNENTYNPLNRYKEDAIPQQRTDGWMEVKVWEFQTTTESVSMQLYFKHPAKKKLKGLMVQGIEFRPI